MNKFIRFIHHIFQPHCQECHDELQDARVCASCETLKHQLEIANYEKREILNKLIKEPEQSITNPTNYNEMRPRTVPWNVRRQELEAEDRRRAQLLKEKEKELKVVSSDSIKDSSVDELEKELGVQ
jgi:hypothetical protein